jgi:regulator of RNase E activity RraA
MDRNPEAGAEVLEFLCHTDTCTVANAIERFGIRMPNEGFIQDVVHSMFPALPPVAGYAVTARIKTAESPIAQLSSYYRTDWWRYVNSRPAPRIIVLADLDPAPGAGAFIGEIHAHIARALGCVACVTNGTVRDLDALEALRFHCFASGASVSHAYSHITEFGVPVNIGGLTISTGDLLHGDRNGVQKIPLEITRELPAEVKRITERERELIGFCQAPGFSLDKLEVILDRDRDLAPPAGARKRGA